MATSEEQIEQFATLPTEARNPRSTALDQLPTLELLQVINDEDATIAAAVRAALPQVAQAVEAIVARFAQGGRLFYVGAGTSGRLGVLDASECPPTFSVPRGLFVGLIAGGDPALRTSSEATEDSPAAGAADLAAHVITAHDTVLGIAASGRTPWVLGAMAYAAQQGALTIALTCAGGGPEPSRMAQAAALAIELTTGPEVLTGSTRMKAGTATKLVLNSISTAVMVRRGAVFSNLMVDVQPTNAKLVDRAERIIISATGCDAPTAKRLLREAGNVKIAILMQQRGMTFAIANSRLKFLSGDLRKALDPTI